MDLPAGHEEEVLAKLDAAMKELKVIQAMSQELGDLVAQSGLMPDVTKVRSLFFFFRNTSPLKLSSGSRYSK